MKLSRALPTQPHRDAWVEVNLAALEDNINALRAFIPKAQKIIAIVKADAYGHGAVMTLPTLIASGVDMLGVASIDEGVQLREAGFNVPILVIGPSPSWAFTEALDHDIQLTLYTIEQLEQLNALAQSQKKHASVQLKFDTGMHRLGAQPNDAMALFSTLKHCQHVKLTGVFSHLAFSNNPKYTQHQHDTFQHILAQLPKSLKSPDLEWIHLSNSTGILNPCLNQGDTPYTAVRVGIALWGYWDSPSEEMLKQLPQVYPVMSLRGRIVDIREIPAGEGVSYSHADAALLSSPPYSSESSKEQKESHTPDLLSLSHLSSQISNQSDSESFSLGDLGSSSLSSQINQKNSDASHSNHLNSQNRFIATCPIGYADGIPRGLSNTISAQLHGTHVRQTGHITMDQLMLDISNVPTATLGDTITLFGYSAEQSNLKNIVTLSDWASQLNTIEYELMCGLRVRLPRAYTRHQSYKQASS